MLFYEFSAARADASPERSASDSDFANTAKHLMQASNPTQLLHSCAYPRARVNVVELGRRIEKLSQEENRGARAILGYTYSNSAVHQLS